MADFVYVSCVPEKGAVARYGSGDGAHKNELIGARFDPDVQALRFFPEQVVAIPTSEFVRYRKEYRRALADGALKQRTKSDFDKARKPEGEGKKSEPASEPKRKKGDD